MYGAPRFVTGIVLLFYMLMMSVTHRTRMYGAARSVTGIVLHFYM
jgi:hypothetical protein